MAFCDFCKTEGQKTGICACCGTVYYTAGVTFIYGQTEKDSYGSEFRLTDKYLIVRSVSNGEMLGNVTAGAAFGLVGALAAGAVDAARKKSYGFYDLQDLQKVIYPYHTNTLKKDTAFKFVNKDGSDFILYFNLNGLFSGKAAKAFAEILVNNGIYVENGAGITYPVCCVQPFVNKDTFGTRVCPSAATFVKMTDKQFIAAPISNMPQQQPMYTPPVQEQPVYTPPVQEQPVYTPPVQEQPVYTPPVQEQPVYTPPVQEQPVYTPPVQEQPVYTPPAQEQPVYTPPVQEQPAYAPPVQEPSAYEQTVYAIPVQEQPVYTPPVQEQPVYVPPVQQPAQPSWQYTPATPAPAPEAAPRQIYCSACGTPHPGTDRFCSKCGNSLQTVF